MKNDVFVAKTNEITDKEHLNKLAEKIYNIKDVTDIILEILADYVEQVSHMKDDELKYDRSKWMLDYGQTDNKTDYEKFSGKDGDVHTIAILIEQIRRWGKIFYDKKNDNVRLD